MDEIINNWKACNRQKRFASSNLAHSAFNRPLRASFAADDKSIIWAHKGAQRGKKTAKQAQQKPMRKVRVSLYYGRSFDKRGTAPLLLAVNHASSTCYIQLQGVRLYPHQWDKARKKVVNHPQADTINSVALSTLGKANEAVMILGSVRGLSTAQVRDRIAEYIYPADEVDAGVLAVMRAYMGASAKPNTAAKYAQTITHIERWLGARVAGGLQFADIDVDWLTAFDRYLVASCPSANSRAIHLRNVRTIFNFALNRQLISARYPFRQYRIKSAPANPLPLTLEQLRALWGYQPRTPAQAYALDIWRLMFALIGINMADLCRLSRVSQGRVNYTRQKTGRLYSVKVEPVAARIIAAHRGREQLLDLVDRFRTVHTATSTLNKHLKTIAEEIGLPRITAYTARYTWATLAQSLDVPIEVISQALGHSYGQAVTLGYIMPDRRKVDAANRQVLSLVAE